MMISMDDKSFEETMNQLGMIKVDDDGKNFCQITNLFFKVVKI
jgi:hypothetical protein